MLTSESAGFFIKPGVSIGYHIQLNKVDQLVGKQRLQLGQCEVGTVPAAGGHKKRWC